MAAIHHWDVILEWLKSIWELWKCRIILWVSRLFFFLHKRRTWVRVIEVNEGRKNKRARSKRHHREWGSKETFLIHFLPTAPLIHSPSLSAESSPNPAVSFQGEGWLTHTDTESSNIRYISSTDCITAQNILVPSCLHLSAASFLPTRGYVPRFSLDMSARIFFRTLKLCFEAQNF